MTAEAKLLVKLSLLMNGLWILAVGAGTFLNNGLPPDRQKLPLIWFDQLLRSYGPLLPLTVLVLRWYAMLPPPGSDGRTDFAEILVLYAGVTAARLGMYSLHLLLGPLIRTSRFGNGHSHMLSDHIFLGSSLVAIFTAEAHLLAAEVRRRWHDRRPIDQAVLAAAAGLLAALFALTCVEMHVTARHFHGAAESFWAVVTGLLAFQIPVSGFLLRMATGPT